MTLPKKPKILLPKEKEFADRYIATEKKGEAAKLTYPEVKHPTTKANQLLNKDVVREYIQSQALGAATRIEKLSRLSKNLNVKLHANQDILDRAGYKPKEAQININMPLYLPQEVMDKYNLGNGEDRGADTSTEKNNN